MKMLKEEFKNKKIKFLTELKLNKNKIFKLKCRTIDQLHKKEWKKERLLRLTASNFGKICEIT